MAQTQTLIYVHQGSLVMGMSGKFLGFIRICICSLMAVQSQNDNKVARAVIPVYLGYLGGVESPRFSSQM